MHLVARPIVGWEGAEKMEVGPPCQWSTGLGLHGANQKKALSRPWIAHGLDKAHRRMFTRCSVA